MKELENVMSQLERETKKKEQAENKIKLLKQKKVNLEGMLKQKERYKKVEYLKPLKEKLQVHVKLIKPIYLIKTQHYEGFDFDLNGVLDGN